MTTNSTTLPLDGRTAVITGASSGIGAATATILTDRGASVWATARRTDRLEALAAETGVQTRAVDVTDAAALEALAAEVPAADLVVANAGLMLPAPATEVDRDGWQRQIDINIGGVLNTVAAFLPGLVRAAEEGRQADLVLISSIGARRTFAGYAVYSSTKAFVSHLGANLRDELAPLGIRVTVIEPGLVMTELQHNVEHDRMRDEVLAWRGGLEALEPEDIAEVVADMVGRKARVALPNLLVVPFTQV